MGSSRSDTISEAILAYRVDQKSLSEAEKANNRLLKSFAGLEEAVQAYDAGLAHGGLISDSADYEPGHIRRRLKRNVPRYP